MQSKEQQKQIKKLLNECSRAYNSLDAQKQKNNALKKENAKMKAALKKIRDKNFNNTLLHIEVIEELRAIAFNALYEIKNTKIFKT